MKEEDKRRAHQMLDQIQQNDITAYMEMCYQSMIAHPEEITQLQVPLDHKLKTMDRIIQYFADQDEFEKCIKLNSIKEQLKS